MKKREIFQLIVTHVSIFLVGFAVGMMYILNQLMNYIADFFKIAGVEAPTQELLRQLIMSGITRLGIG